MTFEVFYKELKEELRKQLGNAVKLKEIEAEKCGMGRFHGICLDTEEKIQRVVYAEILFEGYKKGESFVQIVKDTLSMLCDAGELDFPGIEEITDWNQAKERVTLRLIRRKGNERYMAKGPHFPYLDMEVVFYMMVSSGKDRLAGFYIEWQHLNMWGITAEEVYEAAKKVSPRLCPPVIKKMGQVLMEMLFDEEIPEEIRAEMQEQIKEEIPEKAEILYILTNQQRISGASCILYPDVLKEFSEKMGADLLVLPSSIHETLLLRDEGIDHAGIMEIVREVNRTVVREEEVLSDNVYRYDRKTGRIEVVQAGMEAGRDEKRISA